MRNLKRALSLALASVMLLGMMVVGTSASYADVSSKNNLEAIEVLQKVGIMTGDDKGNFNPDQKVTRNEMAVIMCNLLDYTVASYKGTSKFTDVPAWAEPYVAACYTNGIIAGYSSTYFGGSDSVTTGQAALMLMKALGYFQYASDFGEDWLVATTSQGSKINLFDSIDNGAREALTRNEVAQLVLNALEATMVDYSGNGGTTIKGDGFEITTGKATYNNRTSNDKKYSKIDATKEDGKYTIELGEDLFGGDLKKTAGETDKLGRPGTEWSYKGEEIGTYGDTADRVFVLTNTYKLGTADGDKYATLLDVLKDEDFMDSSKMKYATDENKKVDVTVAVNGKEIADYDKDAAVKNALVNAAKGGTIVELYLADNDDKVIENVVILNYSVAQIDKVDTKISKSDKDDGATCKVKLTDGAGSYTDNNITGFNASTFVKDAYVLYIKDAKEKDELADAQIAEEIEGEVTAVKGSNKATINGTTYKYVSGLTINVEDEGTFYLNVAGQIVKVDATSHNDYIYIYSVDSDDKVNTDGVKTWTFTAYYVDTNGAKGSAEIDVDEVKTKETTDLKRDVGFYFADTAVKVADRTESSNVVSAQVNLAESVIAYSLNSDKELVYETAKDTISAKIAQATFKKDKASGTDSDTQFVFCYVDGSKQKVSTAVGYKNVNVANVPAYTIKNSDGDILYVFVTAKNGSVASDDSLAVILDKTPTQTKKGNDTIYTYKVAIDGEETTLSFKKGDAPKGTLNKGDVIVYAMDGDYATANSADIDTTLYSANAYEATKDYVSIKSGSSDPVQYNLSDAKAIYTINVELKSDGSIDSVYVTEGADIDGATFNDDGSIKVNGSKLAYTLDDDKLDVLFVYDYVK